MNESLIDRLYEGEDYGKEFCCYTAAAFGGSALAAWAANAALVVTVVGAGVATYGAVESAEQQAQLASETRKQKELEAKQFQEQAAYEEGQFRRRALLMLGKQQAIFGAAGVETSSGTPLLQEIDLTSQLELEALNIRAQGARGASGRLFEAGIAKFRRDVARGGQTLSILGGITGAAGGVAGSYSSAMKPKAVTTNWYA
jgi:hypothetical protein